MASHVGLHALGTLADRLGLGGVLSLCLQWEGPGIRVHDRGKVLVQMALALAGGGESSLVAPRSSVLVPRWGGGLDLRGRFHHVPVRPRVRSCGVVCARGSS